MSAAPAARPLVSALFPSPDAAEQAIVALRAAGVPADLLELAVSEAGAREHYAGRVRRKPGRDTVRFAGIGGLVGLVLGAAASLLLLALPGRAELDTMIFVQLLGPNLSTLLGALAGGVVGRFVRRRPDARLRRVVSAGTGVLVAAHARGDAEAQALAVLLRTCGGAEVRAEP